MEPPEQPDALEAGEILERLFVVVAGEQLDDVALGLGFVGLVEGLKLDLLVRGQSHIVGFYPYLILPMALTCLAAWLSYFLLEKRLTGAILAFAGMKNPPVPLAAEPAKA